MMQQHCRNCGAPLQPEDSACASCGMPLHAAQPEAPFPEDWASHPPADTTASRPRPPAHATSTSGRPRRKRGAFYMLAGVLFIVLITIIGSLVVALGNSSNAAQQPPTTGAHIISIQTGTGFDTAKSLVIGATRTFKIGQAVFVVFTVKNQDPNAQIVLKLFRGGNLESTSDILNPEIGTNTYAFTIVVESTGAHSCQLDYNKNAEASISFNVTS